MKKKGLCAGLAEKNNITVNQKKLDVMLEAIVGKLNKELKSNSNKDNSEDGDDDNANGG